MILWANVRPAFPVYVSAVATGTVTLDRAPDVRDNGAFRRPVRPPLRRLAATVTPSIAVATLDKGAPRPAVLVADETDLLPLVPGRGRGGDGVRAHGPVP